jgi:NAD(P)-dependent dehydrogenase (short-subunit alcohol dehydrogenase family)
VSGLFVGLDIPATRQLADALGAQLIAPPPLPRSPSWQWTFSDAVEQFGETLAAGPEVQYVVICTWAERYDERAVIDLSGEQWLHDVERPLALWFRVLTTVAERCARDGAIVVVVERPAPIDSSGHGGTVAIAEGIVALTRSVALIHGARGVRANVVGTEIATAPELLLGLAPPLPSFPGTIDQQVAGAVRLLLSPDASGITGTLVRADSGRAW